MKTAKNLVISIVTRFSFYSKYIKLFSTISILYRIFHLKGCKKGVKYFKFIYEKRPASASPFLSSVFN